MRRSAFVAIIFAAGILVSGSRAARVVLVAVPEATTHNFQGGVGFRS